MGRPLEGERNIRLKQVMGLPLFIERPSYKKVWRWTKKGIRGIRLEKYRNGCAIFTSVEAVERFLARTNGELE